MIHPQVGNRIVRGFRIWQFLSHRFDFVGDQINEPSCVPLLDRDLVIQSLAE